MRTIAFIIEYDGTAFSGWQLQVAQRTVHLEMRNVLSTVLQEPAVVVHCSGRTDAGVHALYQVAHIETVNPIALDRLRGALQSMLPRDVAVLGVAEMPAGFHARRSAEKKTYLFRILNRRARTALDDKRVWHVTPRLDLVAMQAASAALPGKQDFASFEGHNSEALHTVRTILAVAWARAGDELHLRVTGDGFLKHMVRNIAGTLVEIGLGKRAPEDMRRIIDALDRTAAGQTAPPQGLYLERVYYPEPYESVLRAGLKFRDEPMIDR
jgi:tRNA pseudouridine38-40 synthase